MSDPHPHCEPDRYPTDPYQWWMCPECGKFYNAIPVDDIALPSFVRPSVEPDTYGWQATYWPIMVWRPRET